MKNPMRSFSRVLHDRRGAAALVVGAAIVVLIGMAGFVIDLGHAFAVQRTLQASADAAALAGALEIANGSSTTTTTATATTYSSVAGNKNALSDLTVTMASGFPMLKCFTSTGVSCSVTSGANGIQVKQQTTVPTWFAQVLGIKSIPVAVMSTAGVSGGLAKPLHVMIVLDTTASMGDADPNCSIPNSTRLQCAEAGVRTLLTALSPSVDQIGLMAFPGLSSSSQYSCNSTPKTVAYNASPVYQIVSLASNYRTSNTATSLNASSELVDASGGDPSCKGLQDPGGYGTFYAAAIATAQSTLMASSQADVQNVIILFSDGDANAKSTVVPTGDASNQCHQAISAAQTAAAQGTWVYTVAYGSPTTPTPSSCSTDVSEPISAWCTMAEIASDPTKFYTDTAPTATDGCSTTVPQSVGELVSLFQAIAFSLVPPRLLSNATQ